MQRIAPTESSALVMEHEELSMLRLFGLTSFMFATGLLLSTYGMITLALGSQTASFFFQKSIFEAFF